jgi:hypothetical protein
VTARAARSPHPVIVLVIGLVIVIVFSFPALEQPETYRWRGESPRKSAKEQKRKEGAKGGDRNLNPPISRFLCAFASLPFCVNDSCSDPYERIAIDGSVCGGIISG